MRIRVIDILELLASGMTADQICCQLPDLQGDDIRASFAYAAQRLDEQRQLVGIADREDSAAQHDQRSLIALLGSLEEFMSVEELDEIRPLK
jgi:hypothetical protein